MKENFNVSEESKKRVKATRYVQDEPLSYAQALFWCFAAIEQSFNLSKDAKILYKKNRPMSALNLTMLAQEELSKPNIILNYMANGIQDQRNWSKTKKKLNNHDYKIQESLQSLINIALKHGGNEGKSALKLFKKMKFNPVQAMKYAREASIYTSAYEEGVMTPPRFHNLALNFLPQYFEIFMITHKALKISLRNHSPTLLKNLNALFYSESDSEYLKNKKAYEKEVEHYLYLVSFLKGYFSDWKLTLGEMLKIRKLSFVVNRICRTSNRRKYRVTFELLSKGKKISDRRKLKLLLEEGLPIKSEKVFKEALKSGLLKD